MRHADRNASRRRFLKTSALGLGAVAAGAASTLNAAPSNTPLSFNPHAHTPRPLSEIAVRVTNANQKFAAATPIQWQPAPATPSPDAIQIVPANRFQDILGFGGCFSDASCYVINRLRPALRDEFLHDLCHPSALNLNVNRTCIGSADSAATLYSYDDGDADPDLKRFSIAHDREYILPILRQVRQINPDVFYFSSPWSPPGWMKWNKSMLGGSMSRQYLASYAQYFLKFLQAYAAEGVQIHAITTQNEIDTDQHGQMPACTWSQECEYEFITDHIGPLFEKTNTPTKIWILDHNYVYWGRVISQLDDPQFRQYVNCVAFHPYVGEPAMMSKVHAAHPEAELYFTEGSTDYNDPHYQDDWTKWSIVYTDVLNNWCRSAAAWNIATDQHGKPNIGPYPCGGIVIINPDTQEIIKSGQYWSLSHFSRTIQRSARRIESQSAAANLHHVAVENPDGQKVLVLTNTGAARMVEICQGLSSAKIALEENSIATLTWS
jgi:glucosylceramidase